jgi:leucyl aminopeptidase
MKFSISSTPKSQKSQELIITPIYTSKNKKKIIDTHWPKSFKDSFSKIKTSKFFNGSRGKHFTFPLEDGSTVFALGLGDQATLDFESLRCEMANLFKKVQNDYSEIVLKIDQFILKDEIEKSVASIIQGLLLTSYKFEKHLSKKSETKLKKVVLEQENKNAKKEKLIKKALKDNLIICESVNFCRDLVNEPPNILNSETYAKLIEKDSKILNRVKVKTLGKAELKKEKMGMFLSVNAGSAYGPRLVHLTYSPRKVTKKTKHVVLVGKGLTFDTGGYSLKPSNSMINMKFDMAGSSTVYSAFRAASLLNSDIKVTCLLGITDNAVNEHATMPDSIVKARNGKTVEILNTDAEGRLVLGDVLSYASDLKPDVIIDAATLTGSCLVSLGNEMCGLMSNDNTLVENILSSAGEVDEYMWQLPIIEPFRKDMKSNIADLKNIGGSRFGGTSKAAAFLENFVDSSIPWAHLDIAGIGDSQSHLPYCPSKGASGSIVRTLTHFLISQ